MIGRSTRRSEYAPRSVGHVARPSDSSASTFQVVSALDVSRMSCRLDWRPHHPTNFPSAGLPSRNAHTATSPGRDSAKT